MGGRGAAAGTALLRRREVTTHLRNCYHPPPLGWRSRSYCCNVVVLGSYSSSSSSVVLANRRVGGRGGAAGAAGAVAAPSIVSSILLDKKKRAALHSHQLHHQRRLLSSSSSSSPSSSMSRSNSSSSSFHYFASTGYASCFAHVPTADPEVLRNQALHYLATEFQPESWFDDPIVSIVNGSSLSSAATDDDDADHQHVRMTIDTRNALGAVNGKQVLASTTDLDRIADHVTQYESSSTHDLRQPIRAIEYALLTSHAGFLIGNQLLDFAKQDGVTEIVEAIQANAVERQLNDMLVRDEAIQQVVINRKPIYVSCVSNFTNFLDLSRKTLRSLEVGVPVVVLGRTGGNTAQHSYRWVQLLVRLLQEHHVDPGMLTYVSASLEDLQALIRKCNSSTGLLYATSSRATALSMTETYHEDQGEDGPRIGKVVASTGGPNTMVILHPDTLIDARVQKAIQTSATIECAGQCTALRHCVVVPSKDDSNAAADTAPDELESVVANIWKGAPVLPDTDLGKALQESVFDGVYVGHTGSTEPSIDADSPPYVRQGDAWYRLSTALPLSQDKSPLHEYWRKVVVDFTQLDCTKPTQANHLAAWLNENQPISLAINGPRQQALQTGLELFRSTALVVYTIGSHDDPNMPPALTCQARPQEGEVFGEFPPRNSLHKYTRYPVFIPSSNPSYDAHYTDEYLMSSAMTFKDVEEKQPGAGWTCNASLKELLNAVTDPHVRGYCILLLQYLQDVCRMNPKMAVPTLPSSRTALWGLQRPPVGWTTVLRVKDNPTLTWNDVAPAYLLFHATNAKSQVQLSLSPSCDTGIRAVCESHKLPHVVEDDAQMQARLSQLSNVFHIADVSRMTSFPLVDHFVSLYFPLGHIKSTKPKDEEFLLRARLSDKWLNTNF